METIFITGIHGVGKGTLCLELKDELQANVYSCSELIKKKYNYVEYSKLVTDAERKQLALINGLSELKGKRILLDGHFCLLGRNNNIIELKFDTFEAINPDKMVLVTCDEQVIFKRLMDRDGKSIDANQLKLLQQHEISRARIFSKKNGIPLFEFVSGDGNYNELYEWLSE
ncbi:ATP-binding protein [Salinivibrio kushneri]|uniref:ATP-binding protein n=1 Tax=Salinivibrio kushneri TaxID=1908198 RepID=UPI000C82913E|nr:ATP-binding protein [Salinivibrio kushneri]